MFDILSLLKTEKKMEQFFLKVNATEAKSHSELLMSDLYVF
jgi:hypothetical protein